MATRVDIELIQGDDPTVALTVTRIVGGSVVAYPLTGKRVEIIVKADRDTPDTSALYTLSSVGVTPKITITDVPGGLATADFTDRLATADTFWYRAYASDAAGDGTVGRLTFAYGNFKVTAA